MAVKQKREKKREDFGQKFSRRFREELHIPREMRDDSVLFDMVRTCYDWREPNKVPLIDMLADLDAGKFEWNPDQWRVKFKDTVILSSREETIRYCRNSMHDAIGMLNISRTETADTSATRRGAMFILHDIQRKLDSIQL